MLIDTIKKMMVENGWTIAVAESLTAGKVQDYFGSISGASNFFEGGITAYSIDQKVKFLGVDREHAEKVNCISQRVADEMAIGVSKNFGTDIGIATTGYSEPCPEKGIEKPYAYVAIAWRGTVVGRRIVVDHDGVYDRQAMRGYVLTKVIEALIQFLTTQQEAF